MHNATPLIYDSAVYSAGDRAKVCSLWLHCYTAVARLFSLWNEGVTVPARANAVLHRWSDIFTVCLQQGEILRPPLVENVSFIEADTYRTRWSSAQCDARLPREDSAAGKIVSQVGRGWDPTHPAVMIAHLTHKTNKQSETCQSHRFTARSARTVPAEKKSWKQNNKKEETHKRGTKNALIKNLQSLSKGQRIKNINL